MRRWAPTRRAAAHHRPRAGPKTLVGPRPYGACVRPLPLLALARGPGGWATFDGEEVRTWRDDTPPDLSCHGSGARVVVWSATRDLTELAQARALPARVLDLAECHRLRYGGWPADPARVWAGVRGLDVEQVPELEPEDLFAAFAEPLAPEALLTPAGYLRPDAVAGTWQHTPQRLAAWARAVYECGNAVVAELAARGPQALATAISESSAALLCLELERDGLPVDRATMAGLIAQAAGERPRDAAHGIVLRAERDQAVLRHAPGHERTDLRNPGAVKELLAAVGIDVPSTRKWVLEPYREAHPLVPALLDWRTQERIATTYGYHWLDTQVGTDDRLRGRWTVCDGAAGRMTAENGLHNLPVVLRPGVRAERGHVFVRADLGQIEPRVLACVTGERSGFTEKLRGLVDKAVSLVFHECIDEKLRRLAAAQIRHQNDKARREHDQQGQQRDDAPAHRELDAWYFDAAHISKLAKFGGSGFSAHGAPVAGSFDCARVFQPDGQARLDHSGRKRRQTKDHLLHRDRRYGDGGGSGDGQATGFQGARR